MKPVNFPTANMIFGKDQEGVQPMPALYQDGVIMTVWQLTDKEVEDVLKNKQILLFVHTGGDPPYPVDILTVGENEIRKEISQNQTKITDG